jgi:hypothetical protein
MDFALRRAMAAEEAGELVAAAAEYALALDEREAVDAATAIRAALTFFEAKDGATPAISQDAYVYFDRWIAEAARLGAGDIASYWKAYDSLIYWQSFHPPNGTALARDSRIWFARGCSDALLTLAVNFPEEFRETAAAFVKTLLPRRTYRERYLYSILGHRFGA